MPEPVGAGSSIPLPVGDWVAVARYEEGKGREERGGTSLKMGCSRKEVGRRAPHGDPKEQGLALNQGKGKISASRAGITHEAAGQDKRK